MCIGKLYQAILNSRTLHADSLINNEQNFMIEFVIHVNIIGLQDSIQSIGVNLVHNSLTQNLSVQKS